MFIIQDARFKIVEDYGCSISAPGTWVFLVIISILPIILELVCGVYGCLSIRAFYNRSRLNDSENLNILDLNPDRYIRLVCFSAADLLCGIPITVFYLYYDSSLGLVPFRGVTQHQFSLIYQVPAVEWRTVMLSELSVELNRWIVVWVAFVFFAIFGFTEESRNNSRAVLQFVVQVFVKITGMKSRSTTRSRNETEECVTSMFFFVLPLINTIICHLESHSVTPRPVVIALYMSEDDCKTRTWMQYPSDNLYS